PAPVRYTLSLHDALPISSCAAQPRLARNPGARAGAAVAIHRVAEDGEHLFRTRRGLRLQPEAAGPDDVHHFASRSCLAVFRSRIDRKSTRLNSSHVEISY